MTTDITIKIATKGASFLVLSMLDSSVSTAPTWSRDRDARSCLSRWWASFLSLMLQPQGGVQHLTQTIPQQIHSCHVEGDERPREEGDPPGEGDVVASVIENGAPLGR